MAESFDLLGQPVAGAFRRYGLRLTRPHHVGFRQRVGDLRCDIRIGRGVLDADDVGLRQLEHIELVVIMLERALLGSLEAGVGGKAKHDLEPAGQSHALDQRIEFGIGLEAESGNHPAAKVLRLDDGDLAGDHPVIDRVVPLVICRLEAIEWRFQVLDQHLRFCRVGWLQHLDQAKAHAEGDDRHTQYE